MDFIFLIGEGIAHAKAAKVGKGGIFDYFPKLWDADCWRAPVAGPDAGRGRRVVVGPMVSIGR